MKTFQKWIEGMSPGQGGQAGGGTVGYNNPSNPPGGFAQYKDAAENKEAQCQKCKSKQDVKPVDDIYLCNSCIDKQIIK